MRYRLVFLFPALFFATLGTAQDTAFVRQMLDSLCAPRYHGRGYVNAGDVLAARFIQRQLIKIDSAARVEEMPFEMGVNTFPGAMSLAVNGHALTPGADFIVDPKSGGMNGSFEAVRFEAKWAKTAETLFKQIAAGRFEGKIVVLDAQTENTAYKTLIDEVAKNPLKAAGYIILTNEKLTWSVSRSVLAFPILRCTKTEHTKKIKQVDVDVAQHFKSEHQAVNVMTTIAGMGKTGKKRVFTAHLDHLGHMGEHTYIAGANDNASGSAMLLDLYRHYKANPPADDVVFVWFAGEEAGLVGSRHFADHPPFALESIMFLLNLDLMGDAKTGIVAVNGTVYKDDFARLSSLNMELALLESVKPRGPAANSDHYPFYEKGVPCFFFYTTGDYTHYHDIHDIPANLPLTNYAKVFELIVEFMR